MQLVYLLVSLLASRKVIAKEFVINYATDQPNMTLPDGTSIEPWEQNCWADPTDPPIPGNSSKFAHGTCNVCVTQSLPDVNSTLTIGTQHDFHVQIRDNDNHDMGSINKTLAAFGGETGGKETDTSLPVGGNSFHLWAMRDPYHFKIAAVSMDWAGPGPADPFAQPTMFYSFSGDPVLSVISGFTNCGYSAVSPHDEKLYFQCNFAC